MSNESDTQPIGPITILQAFNDASTEAERLRKLNRALRDTHRIYLQSSARLNTELNEAKAALSLDQDSWMWVKQLHADELAKQAADFDTERAGFEAVLLVAAEPMHEARVEMHRQDRVIAELRAQVRDLTGAAHQ